MEYLPGDSRMQETLWRYDALRAEIITQGAGQAPDRYMRAFYQRCIVELDTDDELQATVIEYLSRNPSDGPTYSANKIFRAAQAEVLPVVNQVIADDLLAKYHDPTYPRGRHKPEAWDDVFIAIKDDSSMARFLFREHLIRERIQTNVAHRGSVVKVAAQLFGMQEPKLYEGGTSMGHIPKLMSLFNNETFKYDTVTVNDYEPGQVISFKRSPQMSKQFGELLRNRAFKLGPSLGDDLTPPTFSAALDWARSCTFRPNEFMRTSRRTLVQKLIETEVPNIAFLQGNFASPVHTEFLRSQIPRWKKDRFDIAMFSTSLYQCNETERTQAFKNALELTNDTGIIVVLDFAHRGKDGKLHFVENWRDWDYNLHVYDKTNPDAGWQHIFSIREGRVREVVLGKDLGRLAFGSMRDTT